MGKTPLRRKAWCAFGTFRMKESSGSELPPAKRCLLTLAHCSVKYVRCVASTSARTTLLKNVAFLVAQALEKNGFPAAGRNFIGFEVPSTGFPTLGRRH